MLVAKDGMMWTTQNLTFFYLGFPELFSSVEPVLFGPAVGEKTESADVLKFVTGATSSVLVVEFEEG